MFGYIWSSLVAQTVQHLPIIWETQVQPLCREDLLEKEMATHSTFLPGKSHGWRSLVAVYRLQSMGSQSWTRLSDFTFTIYDLQGFPCGSAVKTLTVNQETQVRFLGWEDPLEEEMVTHSRTLTGKSHGQRVLTTYGPWGHKESDVTELECIYDLIIYNNDFAQYCF